MSNGGTGGGGCVVGEDKYDHGLEIPPASVGQSTAGGMQRNHLDCLEAVHHHSGLTGWLVQ